MPFITYSTVEGALDEKQKAALSEALTQAVVDTLGDKIKPNIWVTLNELPEGNFYIGGHELKSATLKKICKSTEEE